MDGHGGDFPTHIPPPPPVIPDAHEVVVEQPAEHRAASEHFDLVQTTGSNGEMIWKLLLRPDVEKPQPIREDTAEDA